MDEIEDLVESATEGVAFYGDDAQHIMQWADRTPVLLEDIQRAFPQKFSEILPLLRNYRLPKEIAAFAQEISGDRNLAAHCRSPYHEKPVVMCVPRDSSIDYMVDRIRNRDLQDVAVVVQDNEAARLTYEAMARKLGPAVVSASWDLDHESGAVEGEDYSYLRDTRVKIMTYEKVKGQQFETVFLCAYDELNAEQVKRFYVGITRAERFLYVLYDGVMPACLRQVPVSLYNTSDAAMNFDGLYRPGDNDSEEINAETSVEGSEEEDW